MSIATQRVDSPREDGSVLIVLSILEFLDAHGRKRALLKIHIEFQKSFLMSRVTHSVEQG